MIINILLFNILFGMFSTYPLEFDVIRIPVDNYKQSRRKTANNEQRLERQLFCARKVICLEWINDSAWIKIAPQWNVVVEKYWSDECDCFMWPLSYMMYGVAELLVITWLRWTLIRSKVATTHAMNLIILQIYLALVNCALSLLSLAIAKTQAWVKPNDDDSI